MTAASLMQAVDKLGGVDGYKNWKFTMKMYLHCEDMWEYVTGEVDSTNFSVKIDEKVITRICLMLKPELYVHVNFAKTAMEAWDGLDKAF
jgi:hypothetical protein